jgi:DNA-damage-inducible protein J
MATTTLSIRIDADVKKQLDDFCREVGMTTSTAVNLFAHAVARERRLPFEIATGAITRGEVLARIADLDAGRNTVTKSMDELDEMAR